MLMFLTAVFLAVASICVGAYVWFDRERLAAAEMARERLHRVESPEGARSILRDTSTSDVELLDRLLSGRSITAAIDQALRQASVDARAGTFLVAMATTALSGLAVGLLVSGAAAMLGFVIGLIAPVWWLGWRRRRRRALFQEQLPDALDMLTSAMRAGYSFQSAMKFIGEEVAAPLGPEFNRFYDEQRLGMDVRSALVALQDRVDSADLKMFVTAVLIQRETGGNLAEVLGNISDVMRQRADVERQIETLTAESKLSARILAALPVVTFVAVSILDPAFVRPMLTQPIGRLMLAYAAGSVLGGYWLLMQFAKVDL